MDVQISFLYALEAHVDITCIYQFTFILAGCA